MTALYNKYKKEALNKDFLIKDEDFVNDARLFLANRGGYEQKDLQDNNFLYDKYMEHFRGQATNEVTAARDLYYAKTSSEEESQAMGRLMDTFDRMDGDFGFKAAGDYFEGVMTAPSTYAGMFSFGAAKAGTVAAQQAVKAGIRSALSKKLKGQVTKQGIRSAAIGTAIDATAAAGTINLQEQARVELDLKDSIDYKNVGIGGVIGGVTGGLFGGYAGVTKFKNSRAGGFIAAKNIEEAKEVQKQVYLNQVKPILTETENDEIIKLANQAKDIKKYLLKGEKLSLEETVPKFLKTGKKLRQRKKARFSTEEIENIAVAAAKINKQLPKLKGIGGEGEPVERIASRLTRAITRDKDFLDEIDPILKDHKITFEHLAPLFVEEISRAGTILGTIGKVGKGTAKINPKIYEESKIALNNLDNALLASGYSPLSNRARIALEKQNYGLWNKSMQGFINLNKARIGIMTTQISTTIRNTSNGYLRNYIYALDNISQGAFNVVKGNIDPRVWNYNNALKEQMAAVNKETGKLYTKKESEAILKIQGENIANLGMAQLRNGFQSLLLKDMKFGMMSAETDSLFKILGNEQFNFTNDISKLLRGMGDIGEIKQVESGILGLAQNLNTLNTLSDNMFKRAIFTRELDMRIAAAPLGKNGELDSLSKVLASGRFNEVPHDYLSRSMTEAWEFTYQTGDFASRQGTFNNVANSFIKGFDNTALEIARSTAVPFPRYMVNQFRFVYTHAPILGMVNMGGILNKPAVKSQGKKLSTGVERATLGKAGKGLTINAETLGKQMTGLAMLGAFIGLRYNNGDETTGAYEYIVQGEKYDTRAALGPFSMFAFMADLLFRSDFLGVVSSVGLPTAEDLGNVDTGVIDDRLYNNLMASYRDNPFDVKELISALTGATSRSGSQLYLVNQLEQVIQDRSSPEDLMGGIAKYLGGVANTGLIPLAMLKDIAATSDTPISDMDDYLLLPNNSSDIRKDDQLVSFMEVFIRQALRSVPKAQNENSERLALQSSTRRGGILRYNPIIKQLTGLTPMPSLTKVERELKRLGFDYQHVTPKKIKNNAERTNLSKFYMAEYVEDELSDYVGSEEYVSERTNSKRQIIITKLLSKYKRLSRLKAMTPIGADPDDPDYDQKLTKKLEGMYNDLSGMQKRYAEDMYQQHNDRINAKYGLAFDEYETVDPDDDLLGYYSFVFGELGLK
tara:strand:+ start:4912 stop:8502 length:3591 start_codon:yes stop_codon:yes gene_type:complete